MTATETASVDQERTSFAPSIPAYVLPDGPYVPTYADPYAANRPAPRFVRWLVPRDPATRAVWRLSLLRLIITTNLVFAVHTSPEEGLHIPLRVVTVLHSRKEPCSLLDCAVIPTSLVRQ